MKRLLLTICSAAFLFSLSLCEAQAQSQVDDSIDATIGAEVAELRDQLIFGLRVGRPEDTAYINSVVKMVDRGQLRLDLVRTTFIWARRKPYNKVQYFQQALKLRAEKEGILLPGITESPTPSLVP